MTVKFIGGKVNLLFHKMPLAAKVHQTLEEKSQAHPNSLASDMN